MRVSLFSDLDIGKIEGQYLFIIKALVRHALGAMLAHADMVAPTGAVKGEA